MVNVKFMTQLVVNLIQFVDAAAQRRAEFPPFLGCARERGQNKKYWHYYMWRTQERLGTQFTTRGGVSRRGN
jgi:hypothetical protein